MIDQPQIELRDVSRSFNAGQQNEVKALTNVNLIIDEGEFVVIVGSNGSGKSTLLNIIAGNLKPSKGNVFIGDSDITSLADYQRSKWIARIFQNPLSGTAPDLSILDNFRLAALRTKSKGLTIGLSKTFRALVQERIATLGMGLENKLDQPMGSLSGGQRQALTLIMSVMDDLKILLMDEPTAALDPRSAETVMKSADSIIRSYNLTAVLITHNLKDAYSYGERVIHLVDGSIARDIGSNERAKLQVSDMYSWFL